MFPFVEPHDLLIICDIDTFDGVGYNLLRASQRRGFAAGIFVTDCDELDRKKIAKFKAITVVFSEGYPPSGHHWATLTELVDQSQQLLVPFFYDVEPLLTPIPDSNAVHFTWDGNTYEHECIDNILMKVSQHLAPKIGRQPRIEKVIQLFDPEFAGGHDIEVVGIWGPPGIGKKTIARGVHDSIAHEGFDISCYLRNVGENLRKHGSAHLAQMVLSEMVVGNTGMDLGNLEYKNGHNYTVLGNFQSLKQKKVLLTLDGIDHADVMQPVVEFTHAFGSGSRVLLTAKEKCLLESHGIKKIYAVEGLDKTSAYQFLSLNAFSSKNVDCKFLDIMRRAEICASGNPFVLEVIGSSFRGKTEVDCEFVLDQYERIPKADLIQYMIREKNQIRLSGDILDDNMEYVTTDVQLPKVMEAGCDVC